MIKPVPKRELTDDERWVLTEIRARSRKSPLTRNDIKFIWGNGCVRAIRRIIADLVEAGYPICSTPNKPAGYYWPRNDAEIEEAIETLNNGYARAIHRRVAGLRRIQRGQKQKVMKLTHKPTGDRKGNLIPCQCPTCKEIPKIRKKWAKEVRDNKDFMERVRPK